ncbi:MAG: hypothetical protein NTW20_05345 [Rhodobacterales bacterium]|nr:hypothetical protein [Rhodobacterales bacterium]
MTQLEDLLDQTRDALLSGDIDALAKLGPLMESQAGAIPRGDTETADRLRRKAERNARLLLAAGRGLRAARDRLADITTGPTLTTYDERGRKASHSLAPTSLGRF